MGEAKRRGSYEMRKKNSHGAQSNHSKNHAEIKKLTFNRNRLGNLYTADQLRIMREKYRD